MPERTGAEDAAKDTPYGYGGHIVAAEIYEDGEIVPLVDSGRGVSAPLYPVHTLIVDRDGKSALLVLEMEDERMRTLH